MNSFWIENFKNKTYPTLNENLDVDVCIIGGGITGISCGYYLAKNNFDKVIGSTYLPSL